MTRTRPEVEPGDLAATLDRALMAAAGVALVAAAVNGLLALLPFASLHGFDGAAVSPLSQTAPRDLATVWLILAGLAAARQLRRTSPTGASLLLAGGLFSALALLATTLNALGWLPDTGWLAALLHDAARPERLTGAWTLALWGLALRVACSLGARPPAQGITALLILGCAKLALEPWGVLAPADVAWARALPLLLQIAGSLTLIVLLSPALATRPGERPARLLLAGAVTWLACDVGLTSLAAGVQLLGSSTGGGQTTVFGTQLGASWDLGLARDVVALAGTQTMIVAAALARAGEPRISSRLGRVLMLNLARGATAAGLFALVVLLIAAPGLEPLLIHRDGLAAVTARALTQPLWNGALAAGLLAGLGLTAMAWTVIRGALSATRQTTRTGNPSALPDSATQRLVTRSWVTPFALFRALALLLTALSLSVWLGSRPGLLPPEVLAMLPPIDQGEHADTLRRGRDVFVREGCWNCHVTRPHSQLNGVDLLLSGSQRSAGWQRMHLFDPTLARAWSTMPASPQLFIVNGEDGQARSIDGLSFDGGGDATLDLLDAGLVPVADADGEALVSWLLWLQRRPARRDVDDPGLAPIGEHFYGPDDLFRVFCSACHGTEANGDGPAAVFLVGESQPRQLRKGLYRIRSNPLLPTDDDLLRTLRRGLPGSAMPGFPQLSEDDRWALVGYLKRLTRRRLPDGSFEDPFTVDGPIVAAPVPPRPDADAALLSRGAELLDSLRCARCHGEQLRGQTAAEGGFDDWVDEGGRPIIRAHDLLDDAFKGGDTPADLYRTLFIGQGGSPMPSYAEAVPDGDDRWALVLQLEALRAAARRGH